jgi:hypothetical protein
MSDSPTPQRVYPAGEPSSPTIREIFALPEPGSSEQSEGWKKFQEKIGREVKGIKTASMPDMVEKVRELFDIPIPDIFLTSWTKANVLQNYLAESQKDPETVMELELAEHTINSQHRPHIEVRIQNTPVKRIEFVLRLIFKLKGFVLKIQNGSITEMRTGKCDARGTLEYQGLVIAEKMLAPITLPGVVTVPAPVRSEVSAPSMGPTPSPDSIPAQGPMFPEGSIPSEGVPTLEGLPSEETGSGDGDDNEQRAKELSEQSMASKASGAAH